MNNPNLTTLGEVSQRVEEMSLENWDDFIPTRSIAFNSIDSIRIGSATHPVKPIAQRSIAFRLGIPLQYISKCPPELQRDNLEYWLQYEKNEKLLFRFNGDSVRAIFTERYQALDNFMVLEQLGRVGYTPETPVQCALDENFMSLSIPDGRKTFHVNSSDMSPGINISNSEIGLSSLHISAYFMRLACSNGLILRTEVTSSYKHISQKILDEFPAVINEVSANLGKQKEQFELSMNSPVSSPEMTFKSLNKQYALSEKEREAVEWGYQQEPGNNTMFDIVNAYTAAAKYSGLSAAEVNHLQRVGGNILAMVN
ncbi:hypothetical protein ACFL5P_00525 [candidate division KSB1 bacterium]